MDVQIKHIPALTSTIGIYQICIEPSNDPDLGIKLMGYKNSAGTPYKLLVKNQAAKVSSLVISTFGTAGYVKNTTLGVLTGGNSIDPSDVPNHDDLNGLSGGEPGQYYHLTSIQEQQVDLITGNLGAKQILYGSATGYLDSISEFTYDEVNKILGIGVAPSANWRTSGKGSVIEFASNITGLLNSIYSYGSDIDIANNYIYKQDNKYYRTFAGFANRIATVAGQIGLYNAATGVADSEIDWSADTTNYFDVSYSIGTTVNFNQGNFDFSVHALGIPYAFHVVGSTGNIGIHRVPDAWHSNWVSLSIGDPGANPFKSSLYQSKTGLECGLINYAGIYDATDNRWEATVDSTVPGKMILGAQSWGYYISEASVDTGDPIVWEEVLRCQQGLFLNYANDAIHQRLSNDTNPLKMYLGHVRRTGGLFSGAELAGVDGDGIFIIHGEGRNDAGTPGIVYYGKIACGIVQSTAGAEVGKVSIWNYVVGADTEVFSLINGNAELYGDLKLGKSLAYVPSSVADITAGGGITPTQTYMRIQGSGGAVDITADPQIIAGTYDGQLLIIEGTSDTNTVKLDEGTGIHLRGGSIILGNHDVLVLLYDSGNSIWVKQGGNSVATEKGFSFTSPSGGFGTFYTGGFYIFAVADANFDTPANFGTANISYAAHVFLVQAAGGSGGTDTVIRISGTSIDDQGNRTTSDTEDLTVDDDGSAGDYYETIKKWIGQITLTKQSGPNLLCNYGFVKYWDNNNSNFQIVGVEVTGRGGANDSTPNFLIRHHKASGWTYNSDNPPTPPPAIVDMNTDHNTEIQIENNVEFAWKRDNLSTDINGGGSEGLIFEYITGANKSIEQANLLYRIRAK